MVKFREVFYKYKEQILYIIFGVFTTLVNISVFYFFNNIINAGLFTSNLFAWILAVLFAYITNRVFVFESKNTGLKSVLKEMLLFTAARLLSLGFDMGIMYLGVVILLMNDMFTKILSNIVVIVINYILSKLIIFKKD
jgi:putative flippase GtrA